MPCVDLYVCGKHVRFENGLEVGESLAICLDKYENKLAFAKIVGMIQRGPEGDYRAPRLSSYVLTRTSEPVYKHYSFCPRQLGKHKPRDNASRLSV